MNVGKIMALAVAALVTLGLLLLPACGSQSEDLTKLIPEDAAWVVKVDAGSILAKAGMLDDGRVSLPQSMADAVAGSDSRIKRIVTTLPSSGLDLNGCCYLFNSDPAFYAQFIAPIADAGATEEWIKRLTNEREMKKSDEMRYIFHDKTLYCIAGKTLHVGLASKNSEEKAVEATKNLFAQGSGRSIADNTAAYEQISKEDDIAFYASVAGIASRLPKWVSLKYPAIIFLTGAGIETVCGTVTLNKDMELDLSITTGNNSAYAKMCQMLLSQPSAGFLEIIPDGMTTVAALSLNGNSLLKIKEFYSLLALVKTTPIMRDVDFAKIIATIDGPVAIGISPDANFIGEQNYVIALSTTSKQTILDEINRVALKYGQTPRPTPDGETLYSYYNQRFTVGTKGDRCVYIKVLNNPVGGGNLAANDELRSLFGRSKMGVFWQADVRGNSCQLMVGALSGSNILGKFRAPDSAEDNILPALVATLCDMEAGASLMADDFGGDYGDFEPIDEMEQF